MYVKRPTVSLNIGTTRRHAGKTVITRIGGLKLKVGLWWYDDHAYIPYSAYNSFSRYQRGQNTDRVMQPPLTKRKA
jgi:hypothetical protein